MATIRRDRPRRRHSLDRGAPLYDARYEHDACGVGFVADAGGRSRDRVLPLALAGLAALGHRGAFGADGESSDGAGVALPLDRSLLTLLAGDLAAAQPAIVSVFLPRGRTAERRGRRLVDDVFTEAGLTVARWRAVPFDATALGAAAAASRPSFAQAIVMRPVDETGRPAGDDAFERRLVVARRRLETAVREGPPRSRSCPSRRRRVGRSSTRGSSRAPGCRSSSRICARRCPSPTRSSTSATRRTPIPSGGSPSRSAPSPTTARSTPSAATASRSAAAPGMPARRRSRPSSWRPARCSRPAAPIRSRSTRRSSC